MLTVHLLSGVAVVEGSGWCLSCLHEAQAFARDRGYRMQRLVPYDSQARL
jgi:hypothetical protein